MYCGRASQTGETDLVTGADVLVNGHGIGITGCGVDTQVSHTYSSDDPEANRAGWREQGVVPGRESVITMTYQGPEPETVRLGLGVYELSGPRVRVGDKALPRAITFDNRRYVLTEYGAVELTRTIHSLQLLSQVFPTTLVCFGSTGTSGGGFGIDHLLIAGEEVSASHGGGYRCQIADAAGSVGALSAPRSTGYLLVAVYAPQR
jgi:hypothetical protein